MTGKRFEIIYREGTAIGAGLRAVVDRETGVNYLLMQNGYGMGLTPLLDGEGKPVVTKGV